MRIDGEITVADLIEELDIAFGFGHPGYCRKCGVDAEGVEPSTAHALCDSCGAWEVFGADTLLLMSL
jgi:hypothetical protein